MGKTIGSHAVVVGASMGGLLAARAVSEAYERVTVLDRDVLDEVGPRKGVPQGRHGHGLHPRGLAALEQLFPGFTAEMTEAGAPVMRSTALRGIFGGHVLQRADMGAPLLSTSRPFLEGHVRRRVAATDGVTILDGCDVLGPVVADDGARVAGVRVLRRRDGSAEETVAADLVVDATGRGGRTLRWLDDLGLPRPVEDELPVAVAYATRRIRMAADALGGDHIVVVGPVAGRPIGLYLAIQEEGWWILTVFGYGDHAPGGDPAGFAAALASVAPPDVLAAVAAAEPLGDVVTHRLPSNLRRRYERLRHFPDGFLVFGDAICSFNPVYGQGMTVAALEALALRDLVRRGRVDARRFFRAAARPVDDSWALATGADLSLPEVLGHRPRPVRLLNAYMDRLQAVAAEDPVVSRALLRVMGMLDRPPALLRPSIAVRVARGRRRPATTDAAAVACA